MKIKEKNKYIIKPQMPYRFKKSIIDGIYDMDNLLNIYGSFSGKITYVKIERNTSIEYGKEFNETWNGGNLSTRPWLHEEVKSIRLYSGSRKIKFIGLLWEYESLGQSKVCYTSDYLDEFKK